MSRSVLADTGPLYAAVDPDDRHHPRAQDDIRRLNRAKLSVVIIFPILLEAYSLVLYKLGTHVARRWLDEISNRAEILNPSLDDYIRARERVRLFPDQSLTLFDTVLAAASARQRIPVWSYDHHFDVLGVEVWRE